MNELTSEGRKEFPEEDAIFGHLYTLASSSRTCIYILLRYS